jgi:hypothetical protein
MNHKGHEGTQSANETNLSNDSGSPENASGEKANLITAES